MLKDKTAVASFRRLLKPLYSSHPGGSGKRFIGSVRRIVPLSKQETFREEKGTNLRSSSAGIPQRHHPLALTSNVLAVRCSSNFEKPGNLCKYIFANESRPAN